MRAWGLYTSQRRDTYAGHDGYGDELASHYSYDSRVPNHRGPAVGDLVLLRDEKGSLGVAFVEELQEAAGHKRHRRCPSCGTSQLSRRRTLKPTFRCTNGHTFDAPVETMADVSEYRAVYCRSFLPFRGLDAAELETLCKARSRQNAIRELDLDRTIAILRKREIWPSFRSAR